MDIDILAKIKAVLAPYFNNSVVDPRIIRSRFIFISSFFCFKPYLPFALVD